MVSYLTRIFGLSRLDLAEDVVQDTLCRAMEAWSDSGVPDNPSAWLMRVARNRAVDLVRRDKQFQFFAPELAQLLNIKGQAEESVTFDQQIQDDQLRMMFSCCHPDLSTEAQVTLILKTLSGFSVAEIAHAFLSNMDSIEKRLGRARKLFRQSGPLVELTDGEQIRSRLNAVQQAIYLLFNEGYHGTHSEGTVREELCFEAIRLALLLSEHPEGATPRTRALLALLCFHAARLRGRTDGAGSLIQLEWQDRSRWDQDLIGRGFAYLDMASTGDELSEYHLEAEIALWHCTAATYEETNWSKILELYDVLYRLQPSAVIALNRAIALGKTRGPEAGLAALDQLPAEQFGNYPFYAAAQGEFHRQAGHFAAAARQFAVAMTFARSSAEREFFEGQRKACERLSDESR